MPPGTARIPARSRRQAMDWSLVLVSQGIETIIDEPVEDTPWGLLVAERDYEPALKAIRQYRLENRSWPWRQEVFHSGLLFDWGCLAWVFLVLLFAWLDARFDLQSVGLKDNALVSHGEWWRLATAVWLHADPGHLAANVTVGLVLLGLTMGRYGTGLGLLAAGLAGLGGNLIGWSVAPALHRSLGASGMVMGCLGLLAVQTFSLWRQTPKYILSGVVGGTMLFVLLGLAPGTDVLAHLGGFVSGLLLGAVLSFIPSIAKKTKVDLVCGLFYALLVIIPWGLALSHAR